MSTYYNTTHLAGADLKQEHQRANRQEQDVLTLYRRYKRLPPSRAWAMLGGDRYAPLTSIRRAINSLTEAGELQKLTETVAGYFGKPEHVWACVLRSSGTPPARQVEQSASLVAAPADDLFPAIGAIRRMM